MEKYLNLYKTEFDNAHHLMPASNHSEHNADPDYWDILLGEIKTNQSAWVGKKAFDFGCGCGRNLKNLMDLTEWAQVDGCDISAKNAAYAKQWAEQYYPGKINTWESPGDNMQPCDENTYDFIMSHIVMQHISNYNVRLSILKDMYHCLKPGGLISLHYLDLGHSAAYFENSEEYQNCRVENKQYLINDFILVGFEDVRCETKPCYLTGVGAYYIKGTK